ncbi:hypothetical protein ACFVGY_04735 [Streptomyces sp. NPDC127106]|uniref:hypothetical protein n=1 Tax=Streptomyces sp. NPDC127106 TaxID=3345360 RepID=UPI003638C915
MYTYGHVGRPAAAAAVPAASAALALALALALVLTGCTGADTAGGSKPSPTSSTKKAATADRDTVDAEVRALVRAAGLDHGQGKTTSITQNGVKNPGLVDWTVVLDTPRAERALRAMGAEAERRGWHPEPLEDGKVMYEKSGWVLTVGSSATADVVALREGESLLSVFAHAWGA